MPPRASEGAFGPIPAEEFQARRARIAARLPERKLHALIVSALPNIRYLTGFTGSNALLLVSGETAILFTDPRYGLQAAEEVGCAVRVARGPLFGPLLEAARRRKLRRLGFEASRFTVEAHRALGDNLFPGASLEVASGLVERERMTKSPAEIECMRRSARTNAAAFRRTAALLRPGARETSIAARIEYQMRLLGADKPAFETIVAAGPRSALPHAQPTRNTFAGNQLLLVDMGASQDGYASDMTRMAFSGTPGRKVKALYGAVLEAQLAAIDAVRAGVRAGAIDRVARRVLKAHGLEREFLHSTGHGLGLEIHEPPRIGRRDQTPLSSGMVITIEPGAYLEGFGGVRIEDTVVVTAAGCEILTPAAKDLLLV